MNSKPTTYGAIGFVSGIVLVLLISLIGMSGMMWFGRGKMMDGWFNGKLNNCNYPQLPQNGGATQ